MRAATIIRLSPLILLVLLVAKGVAPGGEPAAVGDRVGSLREGNRLFREGRLEEAYEAYRGGWDAAAPHPILVYNLATTAHHLGRLPEAILWYRRAERLTPGDPWIEENLHQARASLGLTPYPAPGLATLIARHRSLLYYLAALVAWAGTVLWMARPRTSARLATALVVAAVAVYAVVAITATRAPTPAVLLEDCSDAGADLPAGSELWAVRTGEEAYEALVPGARVRCPASAIAPLVDPD